MTEHIFRQENSYRLRLPANIHDMAISLSQFIAIYDRLKFVSAGSPEHETLRLELEQIHTLLIKQGEKLLDTESLPAQTIKKMPFIMGLALRFLLSLESAIGVSHDFVDTHGSACLKLYRTELKKDFKSRKVLLERLRTRLGLCPDDLEKIRKAEKSLLEGANRKQAIVKAICRIFAIEKDNPRLRESTEELFRHVYGTVPLPPGDLDIIVSGTMIFFCLPFDEKTRLYQEEKLESLDPPDRADIAAFMQRLGGFKQQQFAHFPAFGFINGESMHPDFLEMLSSELPYPEALVRRELDTIFTVLPRDAVDKYLFHDVVGHSWQASLLSFEDLYTRIASFNSGFEREALADGKDFYDFVLAAVDQENFKGKLRSWLLTCFEQRLAVAMAPVIAEMLADIAEYRFIDLYPQLADKMPSSSHFKWSPTKLDFIVEDVRFYFGQAGRSFRLWLERPERSLHMAEELMRRGLSDSMATQVIEEIRHVLMELRTTVLDHQYMCEAGDDHGVHINLPFKMVLNFLSLHVVVSKVYRDMKQLPEADNDITHGFVELMLLSMGLYFESDPKSALWTLDEFLQVHFIEMIKRIFGDNFVKSPSV